MKKKKIHKKKLVNAIWPLAGALRGHEAKRGATRTKISFQIGWEATLYDLEAQNNQKKNCSIQVTTFLQLACRRLLLSTHLATALISGFLILQIWIFLGLRDPLRRTNLSVFRISWKRSQSAWKNIKCYLNESNEHD